jgi:hypothetical protein
MCGHVECRLVGQAVQQLLKVCRQKLYWFELDEPQRFAADAPVYILFDGDTDSCYGFPPVPGENAIKIATEAYGDICDPENVDRSISQPMPTPCMTAMWPDDWQAFHGACLSPGLHLHHHAGL